MQQSSEAPKQPLIIGWRPAKRVVMSTLLGVISVNADQVFTDPLAVDRLRRNGIELEPVYEPPSG